MLYRMILNLTNTSLVESFWNTKPAGEIQGYGLEVWLGRWILFLVMTDSGCDV